MELFSPSWQAAWKDRLNACDTYRTAAATWEGALILDVTTASGTPDVRLFLDLHKGECRDIRPALPQDDCRFELSAPRTIWLDLLQNGSDPIYLVMRGKLKLLKGSKAQLLPYARAAKAMLSAAREPEEG
jgi:putative sterol carrier protein